MGGNPNPTSVNNIQPNVDGSLQQSQISPEVPQAVPQQEFGFLGNLGAVVSVLGALGGDRDLSNVGGLLSQLRQQQQANTAVNSKAQQQAQFIQSVQPTLDELPSNFAAPAKAAFQAGDMSVGQSFIKQGISANEDLKAKNLEVKAVKGLTSTLNSLEGLDPSIRKLGVSIMENSGSKGGRQFINSLANGTLSLSRAKENAVFRSGLKKQENDILRVLEQGVASNELAADANDEDVQAFLLSKNIKFSVDQAEKLRANAVKRGALKEGDSWLGLLMSKIREIAESSIPVTPAQAQEELRRRGL